MANHRWIPDRHNHISKSDKCVKCGIIRMWSYGNYQCWEYFDSQSEYFSFERTTFIRPECKPDRGTTLGFNRKGEYVYPERF